MPPNPYARLDTWERLKARVLEAAPGLAPALEERRRAAWQSVSIAEAQLLAVLIAARRDPANAAHRRAARPLLRELLDALAADPTGSTVNEPEIVDAHPEVPHVERPRLLATLAWIAAEPPAEWLARISGPAEAVVTVARRAPALRETKSHAWLAALGYPMAMPDMARLRLLWRLGWMPRPRQNAEGRREGLGVLEELAREVQAPLGEIDMILGAFAGVGPDVARDAATCVPKPRCEACPLTHACLYYSLAGSRVDEPSHSLAATTRPEDRPREKMAMRGPAALEDAELLAIVLNTGSAKRNALETAKLLLLRAGSLARLAGMSVTEMSELPGIGPAKATTVKAALELARRLPHAMDAENQGPMTGARSVFERFRSRFLGARQEEFIALLLNTRHELIREVTVTIGTLNQSLVHPRECFKEAIRESAAAVIFVHNHPSGDPAPSPQDAVVTKRLKEAGDLVGVAVLDHVIVGRDRFYSFQEAGRL